MKLKKIYIFHVLSIKSFIFGPKEQESQEVGGVQCFWIPRKYVDVYIARDMLVFTSGFRTGGERMFPFRVTGICVHGYADSVDSGRFQPTDGERVAGQFLSGKLNPRAAAVAVDRVLARERPYDAHLRRPRAERERDAGRIHRQHVVLIRFFGHWEENA